MLTIVNFINTRGSRVLAPPPQAPLVPPPFVDIDGNGRVDPADVLALINQLNTTGPYAVPFDTVPAPLAAPAPGVPAAPAGEGEAASSPRVAVTSVSSAVPALPASSEKPVAQLEQRGTKSCLSRAARRFPLAGTELRGEESSRELESTLGEISAAITAARRLRA